ncbi:MAG: protein kinase domain-containing protein [Thermoanaerobaculia bacterium]
MVIAKGVVLGPYEILSHLGAGGMGEVWRARDRRIGREVAIKILRESFAPGDDRLQRFEQEARAAGGLNHPGLVTIYDVGTTDGSPYIVMELLEGQTLRDVIDDAQPAPLPIAKAIDYAIQITSALAVAHGKGIIHRDLKPENLVVMSDRRVKILDFGLAKLAADSIDPGGVRRTAKHLTETGIVVGTPGYMSPEQARAAPLDHRTDIFSLGSVMYEMISGRPAFERSSAIETMYAVLNEEPPPIDNPKVSAALEAAVRHCLEKDPLQRFQSARDLAFHLQSLPELHRNATASHVSVPRRRRLSYRVGLIVLPLLAALAAGGLVLRGLNGSAETPRRMYRQLTSAEGLEILPTLAPDGKSFAYVSSQSGNRDIYIQRVDGHSAINVTAESSTDDAEPAFSPDGSQIAYRSERSGGGIFLMGVSGESPRRLTDFGHNPAWSPDGTQLVFATEPIELRPYSRARTSELWIVDVRTGARRPLVQRQKGGPDFGRDSDGVQPNWSPHGKRIAFWGISSLSAQRDIWTIDPNAPQPKTTVVRVTSDAALQWNPVWSPDGKYLYYGSDTDGTLNLWRIPMDEESGSPTGTPEPVALPASLTGNFTFARSGELAYVSVTSSYRVLAMPFDVNAGTIGSTRPIFGGSQEIAEFEPSPDGRVIAYTAYSGTQEDIFVADADGMRIRQLTNDAARDRSVEWTRDGKTLYFYSNREQDAWWIWSINADGSDLTQISNAAEARRFGMRNLYSPVPSPDGRTLLVQSDRQTCALLHLDRPVGQRLEPLPVYLVAAKWSPDGQYIAARDQSALIAQIATPSAVPGAIMLYSLRTRQVEKLSDSGSSPQWTPDGKKVVYFERQDVRIVDLESHTTRIVPFTALPGDQIDLRGTASARLSRDGTTLYVREAIQQGDIWIAALSRE